MKRSIALVLASIVCLSSLLGGCQTQNSAATSGASNAKGETVNLIYYTIGTAGSDLNKVMTAANKMSDKEIGVTATMNYVDYGDYDTKMTTIINSGEDYDMCFTTENDNYLSNVKKGAFAPLDDLLKTDGQGILNQLDSRFWTGIKVNGKIYAVPTDKEIATPYYFIYEKSIVDKYNLDISNVTTVEELEPLFKKVHAADKSIVCFPIGSSGWIYPIGYAFLMGQSIPICVDESDSSLKVLNFYDQQKTIDAIKTYRKYYLAGYINKDAATCQDTSVYDGKSLFSMNLCGPDADSSFSAGTTAKVTKQVEDAWITTYSTQGAMVAINSNSKHKDAAMKYINLCHTNKDFIDTLYNGIKGTHWKLDSNNQVVYINPAHKNYNPPSYTLGSFIISSASTGSPTTYAEDYKTFNKNAKASALLGFTPDTSSLSNEIAALTNVTAKYQAGLFNGTSDPDTTLPKLEKALKDAGIDKVISAMQTQIDQFKASK